MTNLDYHNTGYDEIRVADYTNRSNYQKNYAKSNRDAINARKRAWRKAKKNEPIHPPGLPQRRI